MVCYAITSICFLLPRHAAVISVYYMKDFIFNIAQLVFGVLIILLILLQQKGAGLSGVFGGSSNVYSTKRGVDKILHHATVIIVILFFGSALVRLAV